MKLWRISKLRMSTLFSLFILIAAIVISLYVVLKAVLKRKEGFEKLQPMEGSCCGNASAHEVPLWKSSIYVEKEPDLTKERNNEDIMERYAKAKKEEPIKKSKGYGFLDTELDSSQLKEMGIEIEESPALPIDRSQSKLLGLGVAADPMKKFLDKRVNRQRNTTASKPNFSKKMKGTNRSLWFGK